MGAVAAAYSATTWCWACEMWAGLPHAGQSRGSSDGDGGAQTWHGAFAICAPLRYAYGAAVRVVRSVWGRDSCSGLHCHP